MNPNRPRVQPPQPTKKSSRFIPVFLGVACLFFGSCAIWLGYAVYEASTPEGKKAAKEHDEHTAATLDGFITKMAKVRDGLPAVDAALTACPAGTKIDLAPTVDTSFFDSLQDGRTDAGRVARTKGGDLLRDSLFSDSILDVELTRVGIDAGPMTFSTPFATSTIETLSTKPFVLVIDTATFAPPETDATGFTGGELEGSLDVVDWATGATVCHAPISAKSSDAIDYGGGMQLKFHGIPSPTIGKTDLDDAIAKDFKGNVAAATKVSLAAMGVK